MRKAIAAQHLATKVFVSILVSVSLFFTFGLFDSAEAASNTCPDIGSQSLSIGSRGIAVFYLQQFLNQSSDTRVAVSGDGSPGNETSYFGPATAAAVARFQEKYSKEILVPNGLTRGSGFLGASTRAHIFKLCDSGNNNTTENNRSRQQAKNAINDAEDAIDQLEEEMDDVPSGTSLTSANKSLRDAKDLLEDAKDAYDDMDYDEAVDSAKESEDVADEASDDLSDRVSSSTGTDRCYDKGNYWSQGAHVTSYVDKGGTRHRISEGYYECNDGAWDTVNAQKPSSRAEFTAAPMSGKLPLTVTFVAKKGSYTGIDFGDGTSDPKPVCTSSAITGADCGTWNAKHTYSAAGTYQAKLLNATSTVGSATIVVTDGINNASSKLKVLTSTADGKYTMGNNVVVTWPIKAASSTHGMYLVLRHANGTAIASVKITAPTSGTYTYKLPTINSFCNDFFSDALGSCGDYTKNQTNSFYIELSTYTPSNACLGYCSPSVPKAVIKQTAKSSAFSIIAASTAVVTTNSVGGTGSVAGTAPIQTTSASGVTIKPVSGAFTKGSSVTVSWPKGNATASQGLALVLRRADRSAVTSVKAASSTVGTFTFKLPATTDFCNEFFSDALGGCGDYTKNQTNSFYIELSTFTPATACLGYCSPSSILPKTIRVASSTSFSIK